MKIVVAIKQVAARDSRLETDTSGAWIRDDDLSHEVNEPDAYALEAALQLKEARGGEVVAVALGPDRVEKALREVLAKGADRAIHVAMDAAPSDSLTIARHLAQALRGEAPDLILTGLQADDTGAGQTGVMLAELLGLPSAAIVIRVEATEATVRVKRELEDGWFQDVELPLPAVLTIQSGIGKLRYATLMGIKRARTKEIRRVEPAAAPPATAAITRIYAPERTKQTQFLEGDAAQAAAQLVEKLRFEARVL